MNAKENKMVDNKCKGKWEKGKRKAKNEKEKEKRKRQLD